MSMNELLADWVIEQKIRFGKMQKQLDAISQSDPECLEDLGDHLEDIDFHSAALSNILDMVIGPV